MINLKTLSALIAKADLWEKPLCEFSKEEILKLSGAFCVAALESRKTCGLCYYQGWKKLQSYCCHQDHPAMIYAWTYGMGCPDWSRYDDKPLGPYELNRKPRIEPK